MNQTGIHLATVAAADSDREKKALDVLKTSSDHKAKVDACLELARCSSKASVPVLAKMLTDETYSHMARYAMETIDDASVEEALRDALGKTKGRLQTGIIGSLGVRKDAKAVPAISKLLKSDDALVVKAAARALGSIASADAIKALSSTVEGASKENRLAFCEGLFRCAEALKEAGKTGEANAIYAQLKKLDAPHQVKTGVRLGAS